MHGGNALIADWVAEPAWKTAAGPRFETNAVQFPPAVPIQAYYMYSRVSRSKSAAKNARALDYSYLGQLVRGVRIEEQAVFIRVLRRAFIQDSTRARLDLRAAAEEMNLVALRQVAIDLTSSSDALGANALRQVCDDLIEMIALDHRFAALNTIPRLEHEIASVEAELIRLTPGAQELVQIVWASRN